MDSPFSSPLGIFGIMVAGFVALFAVLATWAVRRHRGQKARLRAHAAQLGWHPIVGPAPDLVAESAASGRTELALGTHHSGFDVWMVWHLWYESSSSPGNGTQSMRNLTRYFLWLGPAYPDVRLARRSGVGAFFDPVRGIGTGDAEFDKRFVIKPSDRPEVIPMVTPVIRQAMLAGHFLNWQISGGLLILAYADRPRIENFQPRADGIAHLAGLLTHGV
jgi:hypothetical protein